MKLKRFISKWQVMLYALIIFFICMDSLGEVPVYTVKAGDTLWGIAKAHNLGYEQLYKSNGKPQDWRAIRPGQKIIVGELPAKEKQESEFIDAYDSVHYIEYGSPCSPIEDMTIDLKAHRIKIACYDNCNFQNASRVTLRLDHKCSNEEWNAIIENLVNAKISSWKNRYSNPDVCDGTFWQIELNTDKTVSRKYSGANSWPKSFAPILAIKRFALQHPAARKFSREELLRSPATIDYVVQEDDDLTMISVRMGISAKQIRELNGMKDDDNLTAGQKIKLPANLML